MCVSALRIGYQRHGMRNIGLLGGMSWQSTIPYYRIINETVNAQLGELHSARLVLYNVDFQEIEMLQRANAWADAGHKLAHAACALKDAGAELIVLCTNTMHKMSDMIEDIAGVELLHIADATAEEVKLTGLTRIGLIGTRFIMEQDFYYGRLRDKHGLEVLIPPDEDRLRAHKIVYEELCRGAVREESRAHYRRIIGELVGRGAQGVILGCTEISMLVGAADATAPLFDTTAIHARKAAQWALGISAGRTASVTAM